jgi:hypothetical protein
MFPSLFSFPHVHGHSDALMSHGVHNSAGVSFVYFKRDLSTNAWGLTDLTFHSLGPTAAGPAAVSSREPPPSSSMQQSSFWCPDSYGTCELNVKTLSGKTFP